MPYLRSQTDPLTNWIDSQPQFIRYTLAFALPVTALLITRIPAVYTVVMPIQSVFFFAAITIAAWVGGLLPGMIAAVVSVILVDFFLLSPGRILGDPLDAVTLAIFGLVAFLVSWTQNQRRAVSAQFRTSHDELKSILDSLSDAITVQTKDGVFELSNTAAAMLTGYGSQEQLNKTSITQMHSRWKMFNEEGQQISIAQLPRIAVFESGTTMTTNLRMVDTENDIIRWLEIKTGPIFDKNGNVRRVVNILRDVTKAKADQILFRQERLRLRLVLNELSAFAALLSPDFTIVEMNRPALDAMGVTTDEVVGKPFMDISAWTYSPLTVEKIREALEQAKQGKVQRFDVEAQVVGGRRIVVDLVIAPIRDEAGNIEYLVPSGIDITERSYHEKEMSDLADLLELERERLAQIISTVPAIVYESKGNPAIGQRTVFVSQYAETMLGYPLSDWLDPNFTTRYIHPDDLAHVIEEVTVMWQQGGMGLIEFRGLTSAGDTIYIEARANIYHGKDGVSGVVGMLTDITERKRVEQAVRNYAKELNRSNAELEQFAYVASHDLQEPLRMVGSYLQLIEQRYGERLDGDALEFIEYAVDGANRMKKLIQDLLTFSRVQRSNTQFHLLDMNGVFTQAKRNLQFVIDETQAEVTTDPLPTTIRGNEPQLVQLFQNLIGNAIKFRGNKVPCVHISVHEQDENWAFTVADNGIGIESKYVERIFVIFQRLHSREQYEGTGIGLAICRKIVEQHRGHIRAESIFGEGTTFHFTIAKPDVMTREAALDGLYRNFTG